MTQPPPDEIQREEYYVNGVCIGCDHALYVVGGNLPGYCANFHCPLREGEYATVPEHARRLARAVVLLRRALKLGRTSRCSTCDGSGVVKRPLDTQSPTLTAWQECNCAECYGASVERAYLVALVRGWEDGPGFGCPDGFGDLLRQLAGDIERLAAERHPSAAARPGVDWRAMTPRQVYDALAEAPRVLGPRVPDGTGRLSRRTADRLVMVQGPDGRIWGDPDDAPHTGAQRSFGDWESAEAAFRAAGWLLVDEASASASAT